MLHDHVTADPSPWVSSDERSAPRGRTSRRAFLQLIAATSALTALPGFTVSCGSDAATGPSNGIPASGGPLIIDFAQGDAAILQFALVLEQFEAEFYTRVVDAFGTSNISAAEQTVLTEIRNHEVAHRQYLAAALSTASAPTATPTFRGINFADRAAVLAAAKGFEDLGVAAYNGVVQYLTAPANVLAVAKIVSVEARHAATIRDLLSASTTDFSPNAEDEVYRPALIASTLQANLVDKLGFLNAPSTFVQGPRGNG